MGKYQLSKHKILHLKKKTWVKSDFTESKVRLQLEAGQEYGPGTLELASFGALGEFTEKLSPGAEKRGRCPWHCSTVDINF